MPTSRLSIRPRKFKRYGTTASRSHYGTLNKARASAYAEMSREKNKDTNKRIITIYDANIGSGDTATKKNTIGYIQFNWYGRICWSTPEDGAFTYHYVNKDGSIRKM